MIHYHVWFNLQPGTAETVGLKVIAHYLTQLSQSGESTGFQLLKNLGRPPRSILPMYHALVEFADAEALDRAMKQQTERGIHAGGHGRIVDVVCDFHVEIFDLLPEVQPTQAFFACEI
jgi:hypothetical protein